LVGGETATPVAAVAKDLSLDGMGFLAPVEFPPLQYLLLHLHVGEPPRPVMVPARGVRCQSCGHGWYEVGVRFATNV
jgi:hypothetical protein